MPFAVQINVMETKDNTDSIFYTSPLAQIENSIYSQKELLFQILFEKQECSQFFKVF